MADFFKIVPIGVVDKSQDTVAIHIKKEFGEALAGLSDFSHMVVCYWFHENDTPEKRRILKVYPRRDKTNPLTGVFATHAPVRPNLIALSICRILKIEGRTITIDRIDAFDRTPVIDIKCYIPSRRSFDDAALPTWAYRTPDHA